MSAYLQYVAVTHTSFADTVTLFQSLQRQVLVSLHNLCHTCPSLKQLLLTKLLRKHRTKTNHNEKLQSPRHRPVQPSPLKSTHFSSQGLHDFVYHGLCFATLYSAPLLRDALQRRDSCFYLTAPRKSLCTQPLSRR